MAEGRPLHKIKVKPANYGGPFKMLDGAEDVPEGGPLATVEQLNRIGALFKLQSVRWHAVAGHVGLTEAEAATIIEATRRGWHLSNALADNVPGMVPTF